MEAALMHLNFPERESGGIITDWGLKRIRDFISLLLSYPIRTAHDSRLKDWINGVSDPQNLSVPEKLYHLSQKPLRYVEGIVPMEMILEIEAGGSSLFPYSKLIPQPILNLAVDLAVDQLIHTLLSGDDHVRNIHHVILTTRNGYEQRAVMGKIEAALKDKNKMLRLSQNFSAVLRIDASMYDSLSEVEVHVRGEIARQLRLHHPTGNEVKGNEDWLIKCIEEEMRSNKYLVLLVDGEDREPVDPVKVGLNKSRLAGLVVLITKQKYYPSKVVMDLTIKTEYHVLPWEVFRQNAGRKLIRSSGTIQRIAVRIVKECRSNLFAINLVAKSLKNVEDIKLWELAVGKLCCPNPSIDMNMFHGVSGVMVNAFIKIVWDGMNKTQKHCLTRCLFIPEINHGKLDDELKNDWISSGLVDAKEAARTLREFAERSVLFQLQGRNLWLPQDTYAILQLLNTLNPLFMHKVGLSLTEPPNSELWHSAVHIELAHNKLSELPLSPECLELKVLMLQGNADLTKIPLTFFSKMPLLCTVDLSYTSVRELPNSFFELDQLRELYMKRCECFTKLSPQIGKLKKIEKLDLDGTQIIHMPEEMQELTSLQSLTLCFYEYRGKKSMQYTCSTIIPFGVISKFKGLKHLSIDVNPDDERWHENVQVILPEIMVLECLQTIKLYIPQPELLKLIPISMFEVDFRLIVGRHMHRIISGTPHIDESKLEQSECSLRFVRGVDVPYEIKRLVRHSKALFLDRHMTIKDLGEFEMMNLEQLQVCVLAECKGMQTILDGRHSNSNNDTLSRLLYLSVSYMKNLKSIWEGSVPPRCFLGMLKSLALHNCPKLTIIFSLDFLGNLSLLKDIIVKDCPKVTTLISHGSSKLKGKIFLPNLRKVLLLHLPELISISNGLHISPCLEKLGIYDCPKLRSLSKMEVSSQNLKVIKGETKWWEALKWSKVEWQDTGLPSKLNGIFSSINKEADVITQLGVYDYDNTDGCPGGSVGEPLLSSKKGFNEEEPNAYRKRWTLPTSTTCTPYFDDGFNWRKYAQKGVPGEKFPRMYYTCSHCSAKKRMQRSEVDPTIFEITYHGIHTCTQAIKGKYSSTQASKDD